MTTDRVIPEYPATGNAPISGLPELYSHLQSLDADYEAPLDVKLFDDVYLQLTGPSSFSPFLGRTSTNNTQRTIAPLYSRPSSPS